MEQNTGAYYNGTCLPPKTRKTNKQYINKQSSGETSSFSLTMVNKISKQCRGG